MSVDDSQAGCSLSPLLLMSFNIYKVLLKSSGNFPMKQKLLTVNPTFHSTLGIIIVTPAFYHALLEVSKC